VREKSSKVALAYRLNTVSPVQKCFNFVGKYKTPTLPANKRPKTFWMLYYGIIIITTLPKE
jgi:hypothetical protein